MPVKKSTPSPIMTRPNKLTDASLSQPHSGSLDVSSAGELSGRAALHQPHGSAPASVASPTPAPPSNSINGAIRSSKSARADGVDCGATPIAIAAPTAEAAPTTRRETPRFAPLGPRPSNISTLPRSRHQPSDASAKSPNLR